MQNLLTIFAQPLLLFPLVALVLLMAYIVLQRRPIRWPHSVHFKHVDREDPEMICAPIHGLFVCHQCDTVFNTRICPNCREDAMIPLVNLTGSFARLNYDVMKVLEEKKIEQRRLLAAPVNTQPPDIKLVVSHEVKPVDLQCIEA
jgi:hypothetical protein